MLRSPVLALALLFGSVTAIAAPSPPVAPPARDVAGHWRGSIDGMLRIVMHFERGADGALRGTMDSPDQGAFGLALDTVVFVRDSLRCELRRIRGGFDAQLTPAGDTLRGHWRQAGASVPLTLARGAAVAAAPARPQEKYPPYPYDTLAVSFPNTRAASVTLAGTLTLPRGKGPFPCALLITGSGPEDRDETVFGHRPFRVLADHLTRQGIAVLRMDDRGVGGSTGGSRGATSVDFASDALAGVEFLRTRAEIDKRRIGLIGHSEGGMIAPLVATNWKNTTLDVDPAAGMVQVASADVAFIVMLAGPGVRGDSLMVLQTIAGRRALGVTEASLAREAEVARRAFAALAAADSAATAREMHALVELQVLSLPESARPDSANRAALAHSAFGTLWDPWMRWFAAYDPVPVLKRVRVPVLALNGAKDFQVTPRENLAGIEMALKAGGNRDYTVRELPGLNHLFQTCTSCTLAEYSQLEETFAPSALTIVSDWIRAKTGLSK